MASKINAIAAPTPTMDDVMTHYSRREQLVAALVIGALNPCADKPLRLLTQPAWPNRPYFVCELTTRTRRTRRAFGVWFFSPFDESVTEKCVCDTGGDARWIALVMNDNHEARHPSYKQPTKP